MGNIVHITNIIVGWEVFINIQYKIYQFLIMWIQNILATYTNLENCDWHCRNDKRWKCCYKTSTTWWYQMVCTYVFVNSFGDLCPMQIWPIKRKKSILFII